MPAVATLSLTKLMKGIIQKPQFRFKLRTPQITTTRKITKQQIPDIIRDFQQDIQQDIDITPVIEPITTEIIKPKIETPPPVKPIVPTPRISKFGVPAFVPPFLMGWTYRLASGIDRYHVRLIKRFKFKKGKLVRVKNV